MDMRAFTSWSGLWRLKSLLCLIRYETRNLDKPQAEDYWLSTPYGRFHCPDLAGASQFWPWWEKAVKREVLKLEGGTFVDVGANIGFYSVMAAKHGNMVIALEPNPRAYGCLSENLKLNKVDGSVIAISAGAWSDDTVLGIDPGRHTDTTRVVAGGYGIFGVRLDGLSASPPDLVKIDAEGSEQYVLRGMQGWFKKGKPKVVFEALSPAAYQATIAQLPKDYRITKLDGQNFLAS